MKKLYLVGTALVLAAAMTSTAFAANQYTVAGSTSPRETGTAKKPKPVKVNLRFTVQDTEAARPLGLKSFKLLMTGTRINTNLFPACTAKTTTDAQSDAGCKPSALLAEGFANNLAGPTNDRENAGRQLKCYLSLRLWNARNNRLNLHVEGKQSPQGFADPKHCPLPVSVGIPITVKRLSRGSQIELVIPSSLTNPAPGFTNSVVEMRLFGKRKSKISGSGDARRRVGVFETTGRCARTGGAFSRAFNYEFPNESGPPISQTARAKCSR
jgi:hypothetical protein